MGWRTKTVIVVGLFALGIGWLLDGPVPEGFNNPWELRKIMAHLKKDHFQMYLREYMESIVDQMVSRRGNESEFTHTNKFGVMTKDLQFDGVKVRMYTPKSREGDDNSPAIVFYHGGGFVLGSVGHYDEVCQSFAHGANAKLVSVEYRRAPEYIFPTPLEDCVSATRYFIEHSQKFGVDSSRIAVAGDSAGGNLAAATALKLRDLNIKPQPKLQVLIVPMLQAIDFQSPSYQKFHNDPLLPKRWMGALWLIYATGHAHYIDKLLQNEHTTPEVKKTIYRKQLNPEIIPDDLKGSAYIINKDDFGDEQIWEDLKSVFLDPYFSPLMSEDLSGLPEALIMTMGQDVFRDDGLWYAHYLQSFGVKVTKYHYKAGYHALVTWPVLDQSNVYEARKILFDLVRQRL